MSDIVIYDPFDATVAGRVTAYHQSVNTPDFDGETYKLVNPNLTAVSAVPQNHWKESSGSIVEMTQAEKDALTAAGNVTTVGKSTMVLQAPVSVTQSATFETAWGTRSNPAVLAADEGATLDKTYAQILGEVKCDATGGTPEFRIQEDGIDIVSATAIADTAGQWAEFVYYIPVGSLQALRHRYTFDARLNGGTSLEFRFMALTLLHNSV